MSNHATSKMLADERRVSSDLRMELESLQRQSRRTEHVRARGGHPSYPERADVPDGAALWAHAWLDYTPIEFTHPVVFKNDRTVVASGWADGREPKHTSREEWDSRQSFEGTIFFDRDGRPMNPRGRTGMRGRGLLGKWGPNFAADPVVTRRHPETHQLQMVAVQRKDTGHWAIPGGMVDSGETVSVTLRREFEEEAGNLAAAAEGEDGSLQDLFRQLVDDLFQATRPPTPQPGSHLTSPQSHPLPPAHHVSLLASACPTMAHMPSPRHWPHGP